MNGIRPLGALWRTFQETIADVRQSRFFRDRLSAGLLVGTLIVNGLNFVSLALSVHSTSGEVPIRYSSLQLGFNPNSLGPWYYPFLIALFAILVTLANGYFAYHSFSRSRLASFFLLTGSGVVAIFSFIISSAFGVVR
jgi:hypothetical protein